MAGTVLWWTHAILTDAFPPFANAFDTMLWIVCSVLKLASVISIPFALGWVFVRCHRDLGKTARAVAVWGTALVVLLVLVSIAREPLAGLLNNDSVRFFPSSLHSPLMSAGYYAVDVEWQVARWQSGVTFLTELGLVIAAVLSLGVFGFYAGKKGLATGVVATVWSAAFLLFGSLLLKLLIGDYDFFFAGTMIAPTSMDAIAPYAAADPTSEIGFLVYTVIIWSSWLLDRKLSTQ